MTIKELIETLRQYRCNAEVSLRLEYGLGKCECEPLVWHDEDCKPEEADKVWLVEA